MLQLEKEDSEIDYDWSKPSKAVVACSGDVGCVLWTAGPHVDSYISESGSGHLEDIGLDNAPDGISIWEGKIITVHHHTPDMNEWDSWLDGTFRPPTDSEWDAIRRGECPWDDAEWRKPHTSSNQQLLARKKELIAEEAGRPLRLHWLSFADPKLPEGSQFLGICLVLAPGFVTAVEIARAQGNNPGGEVKGIEATDEQTAVIPAELLNKLFRTREEAEEVSARVGKILREAGVAREQDT